MYVNCSLLWTVVFQPSSSATNDAKLSQEWQLCLREAILKGNDIHDDMIEKEAVDVAVHDAVDLAGDECNVNCIGNQYDIMGNNRTDQLANVFGNLTVKQSCHAVVSAGKLMLLIVNADKSTMIVDSHKHNVIGAMIAYAPPGCACDLALWFSNMTLDTWKAPLPAMSVVSVCYV